MLVHVIGHPTTLSNKVTQLYFINTWPGLPEPEDNEGQAPANGCVVPAGAAFKSASCAHTYVMAVWQHPIQCCQHPGYNTLQPAKLQGHANIHVRCAWAVHAAAHLLKQNQCLPGGV
jgi:hypothetical protein